MSFSILLSAAWLFIALTYLFALLPWTVLTNLDFISSDWRTVKATRTAGWYHFCFVIIPIPLIIFYIVVFWSAMEYTESCAAFLGLYVSFVHFLRTSWGLWQIYLFHSWATQAIESMEEMGYEFKLRSPTKQKLPNVKNRTAKQKADMIHVNNTIVDNQMFHGETQCYLEYRGKFFCVEKDPYGEREFMKRLLEGILIIIQLPLLLFVWIFDLIRFEVERTWMYYRKKDHRRSRYHVLHLPFKSVDVWLNWSTAFAAQGLNEWIEEFEVATDPDMKEDPIEDEQELYKARRDYFAGELLAGMSYLSDTRSEMKSDSMSMLWEQWDNDSSIAFGTINKRELLRAACESGNGLPFGAEHIIDEGNVKKYIVEGLEEGEGFEGYGEYKRKLEWVIGSLPVKFGRVIGKFDIERLEWLTILLYLGNVKKDLKKKLLTHKQTNQDEYYDPEDTNTYRVIPKENERSEKHWYTNETESVRPSEDETYQRRQSTYENEINVINDTRSTEPEHQGAALNISGDNVLFTTSEQNGASWGVSEELKFEEQITDIFEDFACNFGSRVCPDERYLPFRNLMSQLGFEKEQSSYLQSPNIQKIHNEKNRWRKICSFAMSKEFAIEDCMTVSRTNRHALRVGEMTDIWIQLEAGKHYKFLQEKNEWWRTACLGCNIQLEAETGSTECGVDKNENSMTNSATEFRKELRKVQKRAERSRLRYQLGDENQKYSHFEHSFTLMGYGMEFVRSELAHWVSRREEDELAEAWRPLIRNRSCRSRENVSNNLGLLSISLSDSIARTRHRKLSEQGRMQVRLLWEIQQLLQEKLIIERNCDDGPRSQLLMIHCILAFPALIVECDYISDDTVNVRNDRNGNCIIRLSTRPEIRTQTRTGFRTEDCSEWKLHVRPQCAPQALEVWLNLQKNTNGRVHVTAGIDMTRNALHERFEWEWWRDSFYCRLEGLRSWKEEHQFPFVQCEDTMASVIDDIEYIRVSEMGTGETLRTWKGWRPFRKSICRFELESPGYIHEDKKIDPQRLDWIQSGKEGTTTTFLLNRIERVPANYDQAPWKELHNCFLTMKDVLEGSNDDSRIGNNKRYDTEEESNCSRPISVSEKVHNLLSRGQEGAERAVLLLREKALKERDGKSLDRCVKLMSEGLYMRKDLRGAIDLLHRFLTYGKERKSHKEIACRAKILASTAISCTKHLWLDQDGKYDLFQVLRLVCVRVLGMNEIDNLVKKRFEWLLSMLRVRVMQHRETATFSFLASAQQDVWKAKNHYFKARNRLENQKWELFTCLRQSEVIEDVNSYFESCAIYQRGIKELEPGEHQSWLMNSYGLQLQYGINGENKDVLRASQLYEAAIEGAGHTHAMYNLARLLQHGGEEVDKNTPKAIQWYERVINEEGHAHAMYNLAIILHHGEGVEKDIHKAIQLYERAIDEAGHALSMNNLARLLEDGAEGVQKDINRAIQLYERAIDEAGHALSMNNLACILEDGTEGVDKDVRRAMQLYKQAIDEAGHSPSMYNLARMLQQGAEGVEKDIPGAVQFYERAVDEEGHVLSMYHLARLLNQDAEGVEKDINKTIQLYERAINEGHVPSMYNMARILQNGTEGVHKDINRAIQLYELAIDKGGHVLSMTTLACMFQFGGEGVQKDVHKAVRLHERAINEKGNAFSMYHLAIILQLGAEGVEKDIRRAVQLYERAINETGDIDSMYNLACILQNGAEGVGKDMQRAMQLYERAIDENAHTHAMYNLAVILYHGVDGVDKDTQRAVQLYERAIDDYAHTHAMYNLAVILHHGDADVEQDIGRAIKLYERAINFGHDTSAMTNLGFIFHYGTDTTDIDLERAKNLYEKAIEEGNVARSMYHLACLLHHSDNEVIQKDVPKAKELYQRAIDQGNDVDAMFALGKLLELGDEGVVKEPTKAMELYHLLVVDHEHEDALKRLSNLLEHGLDEPYGFPADPQRARQVYEQAKGGKLNKIAVQMIDRLLDRVD